MVRKSGCQAAHGILGCWPPASALVRVDPECESHADESYKRRHVALHCIRSHLAGLGGGPCLQEALLQGRIVRQAGAAQAGNVAGLLAALKADRLKGPSLQLRWK